MIADTYINHRFDIIRLHTFIFNVSLERKEEGNPRFKQTGSIKIKKRSECCC